MNGWGIIGLLMIAYAIGLIALAIRKPEKIWNMAKIKIFRKLLGENGTVVFFLIFAAIVAGVGIWFLTW